MAVAKRFGDELNEKLREKPVEVAFLGGPRQTVDGTLYASQDDYIVVAIGDAPEGRLLIPHSAIAFVRLRNSP